MKAFFAVVGLIWLAKHLEKAHQSARLTSELHPADPYISITTGWDVYNGFGTGDYGPNAHIPSYAVGSAYLEPVTQNPCVCHG